MVEDPDKTRRTYIALMLTLLFYGAAYLYCRSRGTVITVAAYREAFSCYERGMSSSELLAHAKSRVKGNLSIPVSSSDDIYVYYNPRYYPLKIIFFPVLWTEAQVKAWTEGSRR